MRNVKTAIWTRRDRCRLTRTLLSPCDAEIRRPSPVEVLHSMPQRVGFAQMLEPSAGTPVGSWAAPAVSSDRRQFNPSVYAVIESEP